MFRFLAIVALAVSVTSPAWAEGAIAHGENGRVGLSYGYFRRGEAAGRALEECGGRCRLVATYHDTCAAIATGDRGGFGWATRDRLRGADEAAIENCQEYGNRRCTVEVHGCDRR